jgi:hypothetical protein
MANVVGVLWHERVHDPLITLGRVPISNERVRAGVLYPLDSGFAAVIVKEVDSVGSLPLQIEANPQRRISQMRAATRAARAVFLCSAPLVGQPNAGLSGPGLRLACSEPGDQLAIFGEALRELSQRATYLYEEAGRYWFSTQPTLNRVAEDRAKSYADHEVDAAISKTLVEDAGTKGGFHRVFAAPDDPAAIDQAIALSLVILGPSTAHAGKGVAKSAATDATTDALTRCRASQRRFRNALIFAAADEALLGTAREATRRSMAWASIVADERLQQQVTQAQAIDTKDKAKTSRDGAQRAVRNAWSHILYPVKTSSTAAGKAFDLDHLSLTAKDKGAIPAGVYEKARGDGVVMEKLGPDTLWLKVGPLWPEDQPFLPINEIADWFAAYVYLPKLRDRVVLDQSIREALGKLDAKFGYAERFDAISNTYSGLIYLKTAPEIFGPSALIVRSEVALEQLSRQATESPEDISEGDGGRPQVRPPPSQPTKPHRFYGSVEIDMVRPVKSFDAILNAVILELQRTPDARVKVTLEITAETPSGFDPSEVGVVRDNAKQLKFRGEATGFE